jgi:hypothetical protein
MENSRILLGKLYIPPIDFVMRKWFLMVGRYHHLVSRVSCISSLYGLKSLQFPAALELVGRIFLVYRRGREFESYQTTSQSILCSSSLKMNAERVSIISHLDGSTTTLVPSTRIARTFSAHSRCETSEYCIQMTEEYSSCDLTKEI